MGSSRLPGKVMLPLAGHPMIWHIGDRLLRVQGISSLVLATTSDPRNDEMARWAAQQGWHVTRVTGEDDIAGRMAATIAETAASGLLKVNADCPLVDPVVLQRIKDNFLRDGGCDYTSNKAPFTFPLGLSAECIGASAIQWADKELTDSQDREMAANIIRERSDLFRVRHVSHSEDLSALDLMVDTPSQYAEMVALFDMLYTPGETFGLDKVLTKVNGCRSENRPSR